LKAILGYIVSSLPVKKERERKRKRERERERERERRCRCRKMLHIIAYQRIPKQDTSMHLFKRPM
jgi:hypothetical protein